VATTLAIPQAVAPQPTEASSCTGWTSMSSPPLTIRVLRTKTGDVEKVDFKRYVAKVMASGEWPHHMRKATLQAGAVVTKQYAWYYTLKGNHRSGYVSRGKCFDVRDDTMDQLYRPNGAWPKANQWAAIDKTWNLTLRKNGRFFLTGYRAGGVKRCAADANGWKLYATSVESCAAKGWSSKRILTRYLSPNLKFVWSDPAGPAVREPSIKLQAGNTIASGPGSLSWRPAAAKPRVSQFVIQRKFGASEWKTVATRSGKARQADVWLKTGEANRFRVRATDRKGHKGQWSYSPISRPAIRGPVGLSLSGADVQTANAPAKASTTFKGHSLAVVARTGPDMGRIKVLVDGKRVAIVDLDRNKKAKRALVWATSWPTAKRHSVVVKAMDADKRVDFNGFLVLR
jgi:hypothetical protein